MDVSSAPGAPSPIREGSVLHQQALTVTGLLTGLTLTALVLILNSPRAFQVPIGPVTGGQYFETVLTYVALLGVSSSIAMLAFLEIAGGLAEKLTPLDTLGTTFFLVTVFGDRKSTRLNSSHMVQSRMPSSA